MWNILNILNYVSVVLALIQHLRNMIYFCEFVYGFINHCQSDEV